MFYFVSLSLDKGSWFGVMKKLKFKCSILKIYYCQVKRVLGNNLSYLVNGLSITLKCVAKCIQNLIVEHKLQRILKWYSTQYS